MPDTRRDQVVRNQFGFYELKEKPSPEELREYYAERYYQEDHGSHERSYSADEQRYFSNRLAQKHRIAAAISPEAFRSPGRFLDVGAGEGWALSWFSERGWECTGLDYSDHGCRSHHPGMLPHLTVGDIHLGLEDLIGAGERFHLIQLDNVLEHVLEPLRLMELLGGLTTGDGVVIVEVPNDFSPLQEHLLGNGYISRASWIAIPDHISYFNREGLTALAREAGWTVRRLIGDYPMELNLLNRATNYVEDEQVGKACHRARVAAENLFHDLSPAGTDALCEALGELGVGRQIVAFLQSAGADRKDIRG